MIPKLDITALDAHKSPVPSSPLEALMKNLSYTSINTPISQCRKRRISKTPTELARSTTSLRELAKEIVKTPLTWESTPKKVMIVTKLQDPDLASLTRQVAEWFIQELKFTVLVQDELLDQPEFKDNELALINEEESDSNSEEELEVPSPSSICNDPLPSLTPPKIGVWNTEYCNTVEARESIDFVITLGGDGTVLYAAWLFQPIPDTSRIPPIVPFNLGSLGFLTVFNFEKFKETIQKLIKDEFEIRMNFRMRFSCMILRRNDKDRTHQQTFHILNDIVVDRGPSPYMSQLELFGNDKHITTVQADGLVVATSTGSTAYSMSAGGSLVHPDVSAILVTPICPHSLSTRPMLLPDTMELEIAIPETSRNTAYVSFDGRHRIQLYKGDKIRIFSSNSPVPTICDQDQSSDWFNGLETCLGWNQREKQKPLFK